MSLPESRKGRDEICHYQVREAPNRISYQSIRFSCSAERVWLRWQAANAAFKPVRYLTRWSVITWLVRRNMVCASGRPMMVTAMIHASSIQMK